MFDMDINNNSNKAYTLYVSGTVKHAHLFDQPPAFRVHCAICVSRPRLHPGGELGAQKQAHQLCVQVHGEENLLLRTFTGTLICLNPNCTGPCAMDAA